MKPSVTTDHKTRAIVRFFFILIGLAGIAGGAAKAFETAEFINSAAKTEGTVKVFERTGYRPRSEYLVTFSVKKREYFEWKTYGEELYETAERYFEYEPHSFWIDNPWVSFKDGEKVTVYYNPRNPQEVVVDRFASAYAIPLLWLIPGGLLFIFGINGLIQLRKFIYL